MTNLADYVLFGDSKLASRYAGGSTKIEMCTLYEAYLDGKLDIPDMDAFLDARKGLVAWGAFTEELLNFFFSRMIPEVATGVTISKNQTAFGNNRIEQNGVKDRARVLCRDYREIPN